METRERVVWTQTTAIVSTLLFMFVVTQTFHTHRHSAGDRR